MSLEQPFQLVPVDLPSSPSDTMSRISSPTSSFSSVLMVATTSNATASALRPTYFETSSTPSTHVNSSLFSIDNSQAHSPSLTAVTVLDAPIEDPGSPNNDNQVSPDIDQGILEALKNKDRLYVLKLGELMEGLINDRRTRIDLTPATTYQRMLVHRCSAYYKLAPENDPVSKGIIVMATSESRIPTRRICELVPAESIAQPAFKIMRRSAVDRRSKTQSHASSVAGEEADLSDIEPSESGSLGGRSNATGGSNKKRMTIEEREAAYNEARSRIFMDFEDKEKEKEKDMSASSSSLSLVSGSASTSGGGSVGDFEDSVGTPATDSEWSGPVTRDKKDGSRGSGNASAASSSRSFRSSAPPFNANGSGSSRGSRAPSPAFTYASLYEPPQTSFPYEPPTHSGQPPNPSYIPQYIYPYGPPSQHPSPPFIPPYQYYPSYPYQHPPHPQQSSSDPSTPSDMYPHSQQQPHPGYGNPYMWPQPNHLPFPQMQTSPPPSQPSNPVHVSSPQPQSSGQYPPPFIPPPYAYPIPAYYPPPGQPIPPQHHTSPHAMYSGELPRPMNGNGQGNGRAGGLGPPNLGRTSSRSSAGAANGSNTSKRSAPPLRNYGAWSYGPGVGNVAFGHNGVSSMNSGPLSGDSIGPRLTSTIRRPSGNSVGSSGNARSSTGDEASSTSSSTTSSSSRRTYTSTTSSQHPLPARPDWAVGLKPQPTLHSPHRHDHSLTSSRNMSPISPPRNLSGSGPMPSSMVPRHPPSSTQQMPPVLLQANDFPPLTSLTSTTEKRTPVVSGAWTNSSSNRSILMPTPGHPHSPANALVQHSGVNTNLTSNTRLEEPDRGFERPPPKGSSELFNPKVVRRPGSVQIKNAQAPDKNTDRERARGAVVANAILVEQGSLPLEDQGSEGPSKETS